jgi:DNA invertase Pin-like site-specific DNA recombinase
MKVGLYYRVSTKGQGDDDRLGLPVQRKSVEAFCAAQGLEIARVFEDIGYSGATADRPQLAALLRAAEAKEFDAIVVYKWDRLARDVMLDGFLRYSLAKFDVSAISATESNGIDPISKLTGQILASVAEYERHLIAQRLAGARRLKAANGGYAHGRPPYGWRAVDGELKMDEPEQKTLRIMRDLRAQRISFAKIAEQLNALGLRPRDSEQWRTSSVHYALTSELAVHRDAAFDHWRKVDGEDPATAEAARIDYADSVHAINSV